MSVVAYKDGIMAGDTRGWAGRNRASPGQKRKIHRLPDGSLLGVSSARVGLADRFAVWMKADAIRKDWDGDADNLDISALLVKPNGDLYVADDSIRFTGPMRARMYAIGSGSDYALGAMMAGKTAKQAALIACHFCAFCAGPVNTLRKARKNG